MGGVLSVTPVKGARATDEGVEPLKHGGHNLPDDHTCCVVDVQVPRTIHLETQQQNLKGTKNTCTRKRITGF